MTHRTFIPVARLADLDARGRAVVRHGGRELLLLTDALGCLHALDNVCPHAGAPLAGGELEGGVLRCPFHFWPFELATGRCPERPGARVRTYDVRVLDGVIELAAREA